MATETKPEPNPAWQRVLLARHKDRPHTVDYLERLFETFDEIHGDRAYGDDASTIAGFAFFEGRPVMVVGQERGRDTKSRMAHNFGMPKPEGYRKAMRVMELAEKFKRPIITLVDTPGAYPGIDGEERGVAEAIAHNLREMSRLKVPVIAVVIGEGGSGGAIGIAVANRVLMLENSIYSVISPESCAAIIYRDASKAEQAAAALKISAQDLLELSLIDEIVPEPGEGAHTDFDAMADILKGALRRNLDALSTLSAEQLIEDRYQKFRKMGNYFQETL